MGTKISELPGAATLTGSEILPGVQSGATVRMTASALAALAGPGTNTLTAAALPPAAGSRPYSTGDTSNAVGWLPGINGPEYAVNPYFSFGAKADYVEVADGAMTNGSHALACTTSTPFTALRVGNHVAVKGALSGGGILLSTVTAVIDSGHATLADAATATVSAAGVQMGTDNGVPFSNAAAALAAVSGDPRATTGGTLPVMQGPHLFVTPYEPVTGVAVQGQGQGSSGWIQQWGNPFSMVTTPNGLTDSWWIKDIRLDCSGDTMPTTTIASGSNGAVLPQATIHVTDASKLPSAGKVLIGGTTDSTAIDVVTYTGKTGTTLTGCSGGTTTLATSRVVVSHMPAVNDFRSVDGNLSTKPYTPRNYYTGIFGVDGSSPGTGGDLGGLERMLIANVAGDGVYLSNYARTIRDCYISNAQGRGINLIGADDKILGNDIGYCGFEAIWCQGDNNRIDVNKLYQASEWVEGMSGYRALSVTGDFNYGAGNDIQQLRGHGVAVTGSYNLIGAGVEGSTAISWLVGGAGNQVFGTSAAFSGQIPQYDIVFGGQTGKNYWLITTDGSASAQSVFYNSGAQVYAIFLGGPQRSGNATPSSGSIAVADAAVTTGTRVHLTSKGTGGNGASYVLNAGTGFTIYSSDTSVDWEIVSY